MKRYLSVLRRLLWAFCWCCRPGFRLGRFLPLMRHTMPPITRMWRQPAARTKVLCCVIIWITALTKAASLLRTALPVMTELSLTEAQFSAVWSPVAINKLAHYKPQAQMTDEEFAQAYQEAPKVVTPLALMSREDQLDGIASALREVVDDGPWLTLSIANLTTTPMGIWCYMRTASCAGCTRATGLCLNMLGIPYEHVNENQWSHQWCRVPMQDGSYWICDAYGLYCGPEPAPYQHPYL